jgi:hypothetical protein
MISLTNPAQPTAIERIQTTAKSIRTEWRRRGDWGGESTHSAAGGEKQQSADQTDEPTTKAWKSTGPNGVSYRRAMRSAGPRPSSSPLSPLPSRERFRFPCVFLLSECRAVGRPDARLLCGDGEEVPREGGGRRVRVRHWDRWVVGSGGFGRVRDVAGEADSVESPARGPVAYWPSRRFHQRLWSYETGIFKKNGKGQSNIWSWIKFWRIYKRHWLLDKICTC